jgi:tetratricopeptide (TPR) repeat protein
MFNKRYMLKVDCKLALLMIFLCLSGALHAQQANLEFSELVGQVQDARALGHAQEADALSAKLFSLATQAQKTSPNTKQSVDQLAQAHFQLGRNAMERNDYPLAETELVASLNLFQKNEDTLNIARLYRQIGQIYRYQAKYSEALDLSELTAA